MAWTSPRTWVAAETLTAALLNTHVRDNLLETAPAKVTTKGDLTVATAANSISRLAVGSNGAVLVADSATSTGVRWSNTGTSAAAGDAVNIQAGTTLTATANNDFLQQIRMVGTFAKSTYTGLTALGVAVFAGSWSQSGTGTIGTAAAIYATPPTIGTTNWGIYLTAGDSRLGGTSSKVFIGDDANANMTAGITVTNGAGDEKFTAKLTGFAHGVTGVSETDTAFTLSAANATTGGIDLIGFRTGSANYGLRLRSIVAAGDTTKSSAAVAATIISSALSSGTSYTSLGANTNLLAIADSLSTVRFIFDADGDSHQDVGTAWTNFDTYDDAQLLTALSVHVSRPDDPIRENFREFLDTNRAALEDARLVTFNDDGHHFVNMSKLAMLHTGAIRQLSDRLNSALSRLELAERKLAFIS